MKRTWAEANGALREALAAVGWNNRPLEACLRTALRDWPELLPVHPFSGPNVRRRPTCG